jgi:hypothetical protein
MYFAAARLARGSREDKTEDPLTGLNGQIAIQYFAAIHVLTSIWSSCDTAAGTRAIERAYLRMAEQYCQGTRLAFRVPAGAT